MRDFASYFKVIFIQLHTLGESPVSFSIVEKHNGVIPILVAVSKWSDELLNPMEY